MTSTKLKAGDPFPTFTLPSVGGGSTKVGEPQGGKDWQMVVVYRGKHCPICSRYATAKLFQAEGATVVITGRRQEAVEAAAKELLDLIFMDLKMPVVDGWEAARRIRAMEGAAREVPIIALTAYALIGDEEKALAAGCDDFIAKPVVDANVIKGKVERLLARSRTKWLH